MLEKILTSDSFGEVKGNDNTTDKIFVVLLKTAFHLLVQNLSGDNLCVSCYLMLCVQ